MREKTETCVGCLGELAHPDTLVPALASAAPAGRVPIFRGILSTVVRCESCGREAVRPAAIWFLRGPRRAA